ncbi:MAG: HesA/MoeB/ThiF family protein [Chlorobiaceae bacterium]|nr:HesA/MoeB/ThiF family protein [Chlorobiaceae bacterium]NTV60510.1 HesA/MoeB/ThiF family protein [Chlorobiaceae bacterium]
MPLNELQKERYARHLALDDIGENGQEKLLRSKVLVVGAGGLGSPAALYLAAAGIGTIGLMDGDSVDLSNLQRQILHTTDTVGQMKVESARIRLHALDPSVTVESYPYCLSSENAKTILSGYDFIIDATDNFSSKFLIAKACHDAGKPCSHAGISAFAGQTMTVRPGKTACYRCIFHEEGIPSGEIPRGPVGALPGIIGSIQAMEAIKILLSIGEPLCNALLTCDTLTMEFRKIPLSRDPQCPFCGNALYR